jgi:hypothetical protein
MKTSKQEKDELIDHYERRIQEIKSNMELEKIKLSDFKNESKTKNSPA